jgi:hypothetical protein
VSGAADEVDIDDSVVGFHGQQCVEKALMAALVLADVEIPRTHDLELLIERLNEVGTATPDDLAGVEWLTPWAAELRYDEPAALDRAAVLVVAELLAGRGHWLTPKRRSTIRGTIVGCTLMRRRKTAK